MIGITERGDAGLDLSWKTWVETGKPAILITKNPEKIYNALRDFSPLPNVIVHCTITGYGSTMVEPNVPQPSLALDYYEKLITLLGVNRVVLRIDPIIPTLKGVKRARGILYQAQNTRVRISFLDNYPHVQERFRKASLPVLNYSLHAPLAEREAIVKELEKIYSPLEICGEPGMRCSGCVSATDCQVLGIPLGNGESGQRPACACLSLKKELLSTKGQCAHGCLYCYWR